MNIQYFLCKQLTLIFYLISIFTLHGCSNEYLYNIFQDREKSLCETGPPADYEECRKTASDESYREYEQKRNETAEEKD